MSGVLSFERTRIARAARACAVAALALHAPAQTPLASFFGSDPNAQFGFAVDFVGDADPTSARDLRFAVGAPFYDCGGCFYGTYFDCGYARVHSELSQAHVLQHAGGANGCSCCGQSAVPPGDRAGIAVSRIGDINGDQVPDYLVAADRDNPNGLDSGVVYALSGATNAILHTFTGDSSYDYLGNLALSSAGDFDGDGVNDVLTAAPYDDPGSPVVTDGGKAYVYSGASGALLMVARPLSLNDAGNLFGQTVSDVGDLNLDGFDEVVVGVPGDDVNGLTDCGSVRIYAGSAGPFPVVYDKLGAMLTLPGEAAGEKLGRVVRGVGDLDGDGWPEIAATTAPASGLGVVRVYSGLNGAKLKEYASPAASILWGFTLDGIGDCDGDGVNDFAIGAELFDGVAGADCGAVFLRSGKKPAGGWPLIAVIEGREASGNFGSAVRGIAHWDANLNAGLGGMTSGDFNGDALDDLVIAAQWEYANKGAVHVYPGVCLDGATYCTATTNSSGNVATIGHGGSVDVSANDFTLVVDGCPPNKNGLFFYGAQWLNPGTPFKNAYLCVGAPTFRLPVVTTDGTGHVAYAYDLMQPPSPLGQIDPYETWHFQFWCREPGVGANSTLTNALKATFCP